VKTTDKVQADRYRKLHLLTFPNPMTLMFSGKKDYSYSANETDKILKG
jgi:hypothetical protein